MASRTTRRVSLNFHPLAVPLSLALAPPRRSHPHLPLIRLESIISVLRSYADPPDVALWASWLDGRGKGSKFSKKLCVVTNYRMIYFKKPLLGKKLDVRLFAVCQTSFKSSEPCFLVGRSFPSFSRAHAHSRHQRRRKAPGTR